MYFIRQITCAHRGRFASACLGILLSSSLASALTLEDALTRAKSVSPGLQALREQISAAEARVWGAASLPDPKLQLTYFGESVETRTGPQESIYSLSQSVPWPEKLGTRESYARSNEDVAKLRYAYGWSQLQRELTQQYVELAYLEKALESTEAHLSLIADTYSIVEAQVQSGASVNGLLRLELEKERVMDERDRLRQRRLETRAALGAILSVESDTFEQVSAFPKLPPTSNGEGLLERMQSENPELRMLRQGIASSDHQLRLSRLDRYPDFTVGLNYIQVGNEGTAPDAGKDPWALTFAVSLPIWEGKNRSAISESLAEKRTVEQQYRERELQLKAELSSMLAKRLDSQKRIQRYEQTLIPLAEQALENSRSAYRSSQVSVLELIDSERALLDLNLNYWRAVANVLQAEAALHALAGNF